MLLAAALGLIGRDRSELITFDQAPEERNDETLNSDH